MLAIQFDEAVYENLTLCLLFSGNVILILFDFVDSGLKNWEVKN